jgi:hypothetical protein
MKPNSFAIWITDEESEDEQTAIGCVQIGQFAERFLITLNYWDEATFERKWREAVTRLILGANAVGLMTWMTAPGVKDNGRAWILYREGQRVFIQDKIFIVSNESPKFDEEEHLVAIPPRITIDEDGLKISEWETGIQCLINYLAEYAHPRH